MPAMSDLLIPISGALTVVAAALSTLYINRRRGPAASAVITEAAANLVEQLQAQVVAQGHEIRLLQAQMGELRHQFATTHAENVDLRQENAGLMLSLRTALRRNDELETEITDLRAEVDALRRRIDNGHT